MRTDASPALEALAIVPPYAMDCPPAGLAMLNGYLVANGEQPMDVLDLRLWAPSVYSPTYRAIGRDAEAYVMDIPDLPLVLSLVAAFEQGEAEFPAPGAWYMAYCSERGIDAGTLARWLQEVDTYLEAALSLVAPQFIGFSVWTSNYLTTLMACARLKVRRGGPFIVLGGPQVTESRRAAELALKSGLADAVIPGEGEAAFLALVREFRSGRSWTHTAGSIRYIDGTTKHLPRPPLRLTELPLGHFDNLPLSAYQAAHRPHFLLPFQLSRGCTDKCSFCSEWVFWERFRLAKTEMSLDQAADLRGRYGATWLRMVDSLLNGVMRRLTAFAEGLLDRDLRFAWSGFLRADMDAENAALLKRSGFAHAFVGVESLSDETLADMNKRRTADQNIESVVNLLEQGISVRAGVIPGYPGDSPEGFRRTVEGLVGIRERFPRLFSAGMEPFIVSPGQQLFKDLSANGLTGCEWPEEIRALAPGMESVTAGCLETVSGRNQGATRRDMLDALGPLEESTDFWPGEVQDSSEMRLYRVARGLRLARAKHPRDGLCAWLLADAECEAVALAAGPGGTLTPAAWSVLDAIATRHLWRGGARSPARPHRYARSAAAATTARPGPTVVMRRIGGSLTLADWLSLDALRLTGSDADHLAGWFDASAGAFHLSSPGAPERRLQNGTMETLAARGFIMLDASIAASQQETAHG